MVFVGGSGADELAVRGDGGGATIIAGLSGVSCAGQPSGISLVKPGRIEISGGGVGGTGIFIWAIGSSSGRRKIVRIHPGDSRAAIDYIFCGVDGIAILLAGDAFDYSGVCVVFLAGDADQRGGEFMCGE